MATIKSCIAALTRGYETFDKYSDLIKRNKAIETHLNDKTIDILLFHEGNITHEHQILIAKETPLLTILFVNILGGAFKNEKASVAFDKETARFSLSYRHMCSFWFVDFWNFVKEYDYLLRIDEDCFVECNLDKIFVSLQQYTFIAGHQGHDAGFVTKGLNAFSLAFIQRHLNYPFKSRTPKSPSGPYTNLFALDLKIRNNEIFQQYIADVDKSNYIYERRWGDLPLWGEMIYYIFGTSNIMIDKNIKYFHGSHRAQVN